MSETFYIKRGDTSPAIRYQLTLAAGQTLVGVTSARFKMKDINSDTLKVDHNATVDDAENILSYEWIAANTNTAGFFQAEFEITFADGKIETFPNDGYLQINVTADLD